jgi:ATPase subunit of ABC transporter with duplicated ATPase domains
MTNISYLTLDGVSYLLPDGSALFSDLDERFDRQRTGLVGRNGVGKTVLALILAGHLEPTSGTCVRHGRVHYLSQQISPDRYRSVADLAGVQGVLDALARIEAGSTQPADFDAVGERWDIRQRLQIELALNRLDYLSADTPAARLSGGECARVALIGAFLADADYLILDEPTNHLDRPNRAALLEQLQRWPKGLLLVSHDRALLDRMQRIIELSALGLRSYGGGYSHYMQCKSHERELAVQQLEQRKLERKREEQALREQHERQQRRQAHGHKNARKANQAKILLGRQKERSEASSGKLRAQQAATREQLSQRVREAARQVEEVASLLLHPPACELPLRRHVFVLDQVELPFVPIANRTLSLKMFGGQRIGLIGPNGCGKSTLLKLLAGQLDALAGRCDVLVKASYLDQHVTGLQQDRSVLEQLREVNNGLSEGQLRNRLAQLGLGAEKIVLPSASLSGGERLKAALACALYTDEPEQLLLLDEPSNHLDLASMEALEQMLREYRGAFLVASHDEAFLDNLGLTARLQATAQGWQIDAAT